MTDSRPTWELVLEAANDLTRRGLTPFELRALILEVQKRDPRRAREVVQPTIQSMTVNAGKGPLSRAGKPLERVRHGYYQLRTKPEGAEVTTEPHGSAARTDGTGLANAEHISTSSPHDDWFWEVNVQETFARHLAKEGWSITSTSDTAARQQGADIVASREKEILIVEVKGYPSDQYVSGSKKGKPKSTNPSTQARHWYAGALLTASLARDSYPKARVAMVFPDFVTYRSLIARTKFVLDAGRLEVFLITDKGKVSPPFPSAMD